MIEMIRRPDVISRPHMLGALAALGWWDVDKLDVVFQYYFSENFMHF